ncbi:RDD family protein [Mucilaginibacter limnophilus]|uniref:RDD family protein n=1 Tax=Mucilaginibacter limnophilus TaxID=1932778 RepID=A0A3S2XZQ8_9SPHI|nr:RDD family protein [Mucilaginibacter limnophilus]RVU00051.1 RDD family protein [Mucilaginibacter limnophilus]
MIFKQVNPKPHIKSRIIATLIDYAIFSVFSVIYIIAFDDDPEPGRATVNGLPALVPVLLWFVYFPLLESINSTTPGHDICKLKVVGLKGQKISFGQAFKRRICDFIDLGLYGLPALICVAKTEKHQRIGDLWAGTLVVKKEDVEETEVTF